MNTIWFKASQPRSHEASKVADKSDWICDLGEVNSVWNSWQNSMFYAAENAWESHRVVSKGKNNVEAVMTERVDSEKKTFCKSICIDWLNTGCNSDVTAPLGGQTRFQCCDWCREPAWCPFSVVIGGNKSGFSIIFVVGGERSVTQSVLWLVGAPRVVIGGTVHIT